MLEAKVKEELRKKMRIIWLIWSAMFGSLLIYVTSSHLVVDLLRSHPTLDFAKLNDLKHIVYILVLISLVSLISAHFLRKIMLKVKPANSKSQIPQHTSKINYYIYVNKYLRAMMVSLSLSEGVCIYGFALFLLTLDFGILYGFALIAAIAMYVYRPKFEEFERLVIAMTQNI